MTRSLPGDGGPATVLSADPWPGDPAEYDGIADRLTDREQESNLLRSGILGLVGDPALHRWLGRSADAFRKTLEPLPTLLARMVYAYGTAAQAVRGYAQQVRDGQAAFARTRASLLSGAGAAEVIDDWGPGRWQADAAVRQAAAEHTRAVKACAAVIADSDHDLSLVRAALSDVRYHDFYATFIRYGGRRWDLAGLEYLGADVAAGPVDPAKILDTIAYMDQYLGKDGDGLVPGLAPLVLLPRLKSLTPAEVDALIAMMTPEQRQRLDAALGKSPVRVEWSNLLLTDVSAATLELVRTDLGAVQPDWHTDDGKDLHWAPVKGPLFGADGVNLAQDLRQGQAGDCWFLSSIAAIAERNPDFFPSRIHENPNGTYTVTFYQDGKPVDVTVDGQVPTCGDDSPAYAKPGSGAWIPLYEKAYAQFKGGYGNIEGNFGNVGLHDLTGQSTARLPSHHVTLADVAGWLAKGQAITADSRQDKGFYGWGADGTYIGGGRVVSGHVYSVEKVDMNAHPPTVTLLNPWGVAAEHDGTSIGQVTLTEAELQNLFGSVDVTKVRP